METPTLCAILKIEFTEENQFIVETMLMNFIRTLNEGDKLHNVLYSTIRDINFNGINNYHYQVIEMCEELLSIQVLG